MDLYEEQIQLERGMVQYGKDRYLKGTAEAEEKGRGSETSYARRLLSVLCTDVASSIEAFCTTTTPGRLQHSKKVLMKLEPNQSAYIALKSIFDALTMQMPLTQVALCVGNKIEDEIRFTAFEKQTPNLYNHIVREFEERNVVNYKRKHRLLTNVHNRYGGSGWRGLSKVDKIHVGTKLIELVIKSTGMFQVKYTRTKGKKAVNMLEATPETMEWIDEHIHRFALLHPDFAPTVIPPKPWTGLRNGGYYLEPLARRCPFIKLDTRLPKSTKVPHDYSAAMQAVNKVQETPWRINQFVLSAMQDAWRKNLRIGMPPSEPYDFPPAPFDRDLKKQAMTEAQLNRFSLWKKETSDLHTLEKTRVSKCMLLARVLSSAVKYTKYKEFYFVYNCDFRGRIYATSSGFSPQGPDISKGILEFSNGKALGKTGFRWLCIHGANVFGFDKASYQERYEWCLERKDELIQIGKDPYSAGALKIWGDADKPYQFLAFCKEFSEAVYDREDYISHLPIALDGSCNGLQHFSAILRDEVGGKAVNLLPSLKPEDIYAEVAVVCTEKLKALASSGADVKRYAAKALKFGIDRKITKKPVMTLPYGSTLRNCLNRTTEFLMDNSERYNWGDEVYTGGIYVGKIIWSSIDEVVIAARSAMSWLRHVSTFVSRRNKPIVWVTPTGFLVYQINTERERIEVKTQLLGRLSCWINEDTNRIKETAQANGISPNFIHSLDASHLMLTVNASDFDSYAMIHDSFGTHACDTEDLARILREEFVSMYTEHDVLQELKESLEDQHNLSLPDVPEKGNLDISQVIDSKYFFG